MITAELKTGYNYSKIVRMVHPERTSTICLEGGGRSGKTRDICSLMIEIAANADRLKYFDPVTKIWRRVKTILIAGELWAWLKIRAYADFLNHLKDGNIYNSRAHNKSNHTYDINGVKFIFMGADDPQKFKGVESDIAWINEPVPGFPYESFEFIKQRCGWFTILDWNPVVPDPGKESEERHWCYKLADREGVYFQKSTILNNPFAPAGARETILGYEPTEANVKAGTANPRLWKVFGLGERAGLDGLIYNNFHELKEAPEGRQVVGYGGDFGFTTDPLAFVEVSKMRFNPNGSARPALFVRTMIYETGLLNSDTVLKQKQMRVNVHLPQVWDSAQIKDIEEFQRKYMLCAIPCTKGAGSIKSGINRVKEYDIFAVKGDPILRESILYSRKLMPGSDNVYMDEPIDKYNHAMDALRYFITEIL